MTASNGQTFRVALLGCGQIADAHLKELAKIPAVRVIATCDMHLDLAKQAALRFGVPRFYDDYAAMLAAEHPDVVHIATPAQSHALLAIEMLKAGANVYVEKPLALDEPEVRDILATAHAHQRVVCAGHDQLFDPCWLEARRRVDGGEIGTVSHIESILGYPLSGQFGSAVRADAGHWVRRLPGGLFQNTISHPLYRITEFLGDERPEIFAHWWAKPGFDFPTEMFVHLRGQPVTGQLTFSTTIANQRVTRIYGSLGTLEVDLDAQSVIRHTPPKMPGAFGKIDSPWRQKREAGKALKRNIRRFIKSDIHYFAGMRTLFEKFYSAVGAPGQPWPISAEEMLRVTRIMDMTFVACRKFETAQGGHGELPPEHAARPVHPIVAAKS